MIIFEKLRYKNFLSTGNQFTEIELNKYANTLIVGKNGAGKSTVLDAICYALFAKPFRGINKPQLVNSITKKNCLVELEFSIGGAKYMIRRGIKPAVFEVIKNGQMLNQSAESKDYQEILEKQILKLNYKSFRQIVILGSSSFVPFMALTTGHRREIIEDLLDLQIFTTMNVLLKERIANNTKLMIEINARIGLAKEKIDLYNKHMVQVQKDNDNLIADKRNIVALKQEEAEVHWAVVQECNTEINRLTALITDEKFGEVIQKSHRLKTKVEVQRDTLLKEITFFKEHNDCPTCQQTINDTFRNKRIIDNEKQVIKIDNGLKKLNAEIAEIKTRFDQQSQLSHELIDVKTKRANHEVIYHSCVDYYTHLAHEIARIAKTTPEYHGARIDEITAELKQAEIELEAATEDKSTYAAATVLLKDTGIKAKIIKQYVPIINKLINKYLSALDFFVQFELNESFEETIKSRYRDEFSYESFSEGEKKRINLAIIFTWRAIAKLRNSANTNLFVLDEVFDSSLDLMGTEDVLKLLLSLSAENTFIISHNPSAAGDKFANVIKFEKKQSFSRIVSA